MGILERLFGKPIAIVDPVAECEAVADKTCTLGFWVSSLDQELDRRVQSVIQQKSIVVPHRQHLQNTRDAYKTLKTTIGNQRKVAKDALKSVKSVKGPITPEPDPVPQTVIDQFDNTLRELQEEQIAGVDRAEAVLENVLAGMDVREQNTDHQVSEVTSQIDRVVKVEQKLTTEEETINLLKKNLVQFAVLKRVSPPKKQD